METKKNWGMTEIFCNWDEYENLEIEYNLVDYGMSGQYHGWHWFQDDDAQVAVYAK